MARPIKERIQELRDEIAEISKANQEHLHRRKYSSPVAEQDRRLLRLQEILDELMSMTGKSREDQSLRGSGRIRAYNQHQLSLIHTQLKVGSANQRHPLLTSSDSSQRKFK